MNSYLNQAVLANLPAGLRREGDGPWTLEGQWIAKKPQRVRWVRTASVIIHDIADFQQSSQLDAIAAGPPTSPGLADLQALREEEKNTDAPLTSHAYERAWETIEYLDALAGPLLVSPHLASDENGGIRMEWFGVNGSNVRALISGQYDRQSYVYLFFNAQSRLVPLTNATLLMTLREYVIPR